MTVTPLRPRTATNARKSVEVAAELAETFAETAGDYDESAAFPYENIFRLHDAGLVALTAPVEFGGAGAGLGEASDVIREIARGEPSTALILIMQYINLATLPKSRWPEHLVRKVIGDAVDNGALINAFRVGWCAFSRSGCRPISGSRWQPFPASSRRSARSRNLSRSIAG